MTMPGFTAEASLLPSYNKFIGHGISGALVNQIVPAFPCCEACGISCGIYEECNAMGGFPIDPQCTYSSNRCVNCLRWCRPCPGLFDPPPDPSPFDPPWVYR
jgi:hypothetical protein